MLKERVKKMFAEMVEKKQLSEIPVYYHRDMILHSNGGQMDYQEFYDIHKQVYGTDITYKIKYDEETFVEEKDKLAARVFITTETPDEGSKELEVVLIILFKEDKIYRLWELTYPDWSQMESFKDL